MSKTKWERKAPAPTYRIPVPDESPSVTEMGLRAQNNCLQQEINELKEENARLHKKVETNQRIMTYLGDSAAYVKWLIQRLEQNDEASYEEH